MASVLIVDDDEDDREFFCIAIQELDSRISCIMARNGEEALQGLRLEKFPKPDMIILDLNMPRLGGFDFLRELKKDRELKDIPVVILTAFILEEDRNDAISLGVQHYFAKPNSFKELCQIFKDVFAREMISTK